MISRTSHSVTAALAAGSLLTALVLPAGADEKPLRALLICGGCCHDYAAQQEILSKGIQARANVQVDVLYSPDSSTKAVFDVYKSPDWAKGYDVIIHDECSADVKDMPYVQNILHAHQTVPAVNLHCAMHCYRTGTDDWFKFIGIQSSGHGAQLPIAIEFVDHDHPAVKGLTDWTTINEELYNNINIFPTATPLATGLQKTPQKDGSVREEKTVVAWSNLYAGKTRIFSTTIGHNNATVADERYLEMVTRGLLWAVDKPDAALRKPFAGQNVVTKLPPPAPEPPAAPPAPAADATRVRLSASSTQEGNEMWKAIDGNPETRWCAADGSQPQWLQLDFRQPQKLTGARIVWEREQPYHYKLEGSADGKEWKMLHDGTGNDKPGPSEPAFTADGIRSVRITCTGSTHGGWASIREVSLTGPGIKSLAAMRRGNRPGQAVRPDGAPAGEDPLKKEGNITPSIVKLTPDEEAGILRDVKVPDGFDLTLFAAPPAANYPVYVAAAPDGTLYVSSDGNGSLGRNAHRGRILRLRDTDKDGRADEVKEFVKDLDAPRGLVWDHDRLYVIHPPDVSVFIDKDGDGISDEQKTLIRGIAFGYPDRPADHTTNGLSIGIDGWLYIAGGDFGFMDAAGTDGRHLQHRGGGVIRFRPDGSNLELYATGTRNILEVAVSPLMDIFARDNTNDGGGWDVRFHHFTGLENHGYPRLYKNFADEAITPLADYGGGSGCGAVYLDEPGFPDQWNHAPLTADWGTGALWHHDVKRKGASYEEVSKPEPFVRMTRPTDGDVDAMSHLYAASWKGATFDWQGPDVGYIVRVSPKGYQPEPLPDFDKLSPAALVELLDSPSHRRRLEAQRTLLRRGIDKETALTLTKIARDEAKSLATRVAAVFAIKQGFGVKASEELARIADNASIRAWALRALGDRADEAASAPAAPLAAGLKDADPVVRLQALTSSTRRGQLDLAPAMATLLGDADPVIVLTASRCLAMINAHDACFAVVDDTGASAAARTAALRSLAMMHSTPVVDGLLSRLTSTSAGAFRQGLLGALARLHFKEGVWKGDSWGTRPDTTGPYYQPAEWDESGRIAEALLTALSAAGPDEAAWLTAEMNRNRMKTEGGLERMVGLALRDDRLIPGVVGQLATTSTLPDGAVPVLVKAVNLPDAPLPVLLDAIDGLAKADGTDAAAALLNGMSAISAAKAPDKQMKRARKAFTGAPKLENAHQFYEAAATKTGTPEALWADVALLELAGRTTGAPESAEMSGKALAAGWEVPARRAQIIRAVAEARAFSWSEKVLAALADPDAAVAEAAKSTVVSMKFKKRGSEPTVAEMKPEDVLTQVVAAKGDIELGEVLFTRQTCVNCHTVSQDQAQRGPYLGNIADTYKRPELAANILDPNKTIAQGFATELFTLKNGQVEMGFVTLEAADKVVIRNIAAQEFTFPTGDIEKREKVPTSLMPPGLVNGLTIEEFASLLDYLESLAKQKKK